MKNLNIKHYHQAYHPYELPATQTQTQQQQYQPHLSSATNPATFLNSYNSNSTLIPTSNYQRFNNFNNSYNSAITSTTTSRNLEDCKTLATSINSNHNNSNSHNSNLPLTSSATSTSSPPPPTLGGYLANQQQQRLQQLQQQQQHHNFQLPTPSNHQQQQSQHQTLNMLSLNQTNTFNYNFHFNNNNNFNSNSNNNNNHLNHHNSNHNIVNNSQPNHNKYNNHLNNSALLSRPQRPNSLNISAMASLASLPSSSFPYSSPAIMSNNNDHAAPLSATPGAGNFTPNHYFYKNNNSNQRENVFNFPSSQQQQQQQQHHHNNSNNYNSLQQHQQNYNNYQANQQQQQYQQQQQQLQQFQLLQQQLKHQQQMQLNNNNSNNNNNSICNLTTPNSATAVATTSSCSSSSLAATSNIATTSGTIAANNDPPTTSAAAAASNPNSDQTNNSSNCDKLTMDACEIANFLANELFMQQLVSMECMQTGVPTLTTPTLTPTTLKSIEESFIQLTSEPINAPYQAGFIPPPLASYNPSTTNTTNNNNNNVTLTTATTSVAGISPNAALNNVYLGDISAGASLPEYETDNSQGSWTGNNLNEENSMATTDTSSAATDSISFQNGLNISNSSNTNDFSSVNLAALAVATAAAKISQPNNNNTSSSATTTTTTPSRRGGGRRPATNSNITPEEEEKRRIRRERNKLAAARCRKRRVDQTNELTDEVTLLERKREELQKQIEQLNGTKQDLEFLLEAHRPECQRVVASDILSVNTFDGLMPATSSATASENITGLDTSLATTARSISPLDLKPVLNDQLLAQIKDEPLDSALDSNSSLDQDGPTPTKRLLLTNNNPMIPPPLPNVATLSASLAAASASLNTPIVTTAPVSFGSMYSNNPSLSAPLIKPNSKQRPNSLPTIPRNLAQTIGLGDNKQPPTDINGVAIQTPSTGMFNFDSLMDGGTGLTPVSGPLVPNCSSQNKHPLELVTPTSEPSKLVSL